MINSFDKIEKDIDEFYFFRRSIVDGVLGGLNMKISKLDQENNKLQCRIESLELTTDKAEQNSSRNCLRLSGLPELKDKITDDTVMEVAAAIGADLSIDEVDCNQRVGKQKKLSRRD